MDRELEFKIARHSMSSRYHCISWRYRPISLLDKLFCSSYHTVVVSFKIGLAYCYPCYNPLLSDYDSLVKLAEGWKSNPKSFDDFRNKVIDNYNKLYQEAEDINKKLNKSKIV
jgi:hypothetical protein